MADDETETENHGEERDLRELVEQGHRVLERLDELIAAERAIANTLGTFLADWQAAHRPTIGPVKGVLSIQGATMGLTVDTTPGAESLTFDFEDDHGNVSAAPTGDGSGLVVALTSGDDTVATVGATTEGTREDGEPNWTAPITVVTTVPGTATFGCDLSNSSGAPLTEDDGATPFPAVEPVSVPVTAGDPVEGSLGIAP